MKGRPPRHQDKQSHLLAPLQNRFLNFCWKPGCLISGTNLIALRNTARTEVHCKTARPHRQKLARRLQYSSPALPFRCCVNGSENILPMHSVFETSPLRSLITAHGLKHLSVQRLTISDGMTCAIHGQAGTFRQEHRFMCCKSWAAGNRRRW